MSLTRKPHKSLISILGLTAVTVFGVAGILGSGGGGDDGDGGRNDPVYDGLTTQALITADNVQALGELAFLGTSVATTPVVAYIQPAPVADSRKPSVVAIVRVLHATANVADVTNAISTLPVGWVESMPSTPGMCGGSLSGSLEVNESEQTFTGNMVFEDYCNFGLTMDGTVGLDGSCDPATFDVAEQVCDPSELTMEFTAFNTSGLGTSQTMGGTIYSATTASGYEDTLNLRLRDENTGVTFKYEDYVTNVSEDLEGEIVEVTGKPYHPSYGYVVVSTPTPVQVVSCCDTPPQSGVVLLTGANGTAGGPTTATFTFGADGTFALDVDTAGDGETDVALTCDWETYVCNP